MPLVALGARSLRGVRFGYARALLLLRLRLRLRMGLRLRSNLRLGSNLRRRMGLWLRNNRRLGTQLLRGDGFGHARALLLADLRLRRLRERVRSDLLPPLPVD